MQGERQIFVSGFEISLTKAFFIRISADIKINWVKTNDSTAAMDFLKGLAVIILVKEWGGEGLGGSGGFSPSASPVFSSSKAPERRSPSRLAGVSEDSTTEGRRLLAGRGSELVCRVVRECRRHKKQSKPKARPKVLVVVMV